MKGNLYIILGDDDYLVNSEAEKCIGRHVERQNRDFGLEIIDGRVSTGAAVKACVDTVINSVQTPSFLGGDKVTWLRDAHFLPGGGKVSEYVESKEAVDKLTAVLDQDLQQGQVLVVTTAKIRKNSAFFKSCSRLAAVEDFGSGLKGWEQEKMAAPRLDRFIEERGIQMGFAARKEFLHRVGFDTRTIVSELEKLSLFALGAGEISVQDVREIVCVGGEAEAWDVLEAFGARNAVKLIEGIERLSGQSGIAIMLAAMLDKNIRDMLVLREAHDCKWIRNGRWADKLPVEAEMMLKNLSGGYLGMPGWMLKKKLDHALNYTQQELRVARFRIIEMRERLVSTGQPEFFLLQTALLRIMARKEKPAAGVARGS